MIDFRSDTVTLPDEGMRGAMASAELGDDVYREDPTVNRLESMAADMSGHDSALFFPTGTQSNLAALLTHCERGDEYIVGQNAHTYKYEGGGAAVLGGIQPQPIEFEADGTLDLEKIRAKIKPDDFHFAKTRLLALENTVGGQVIGNDYIRRAQWLAREHGLSFHLDGARIMNAAVAQEIPWHEIAVYFDSVSICLSKGLGAPAGSVLCGPDPFIVKARRWRKVLGGGMRQAGVVASAGIYALENNIERLADDHANAACLAEGLLAIDELSIRNDAAQTNMVFASMENSAMKKLLPFMRDNGILLSAGNPMRLVTHLDISKQDIDFAIEKFKSFFQQNNSV